MVHYQPDLIIAISRKGPRLLELMRKLSIRLPDCPITTELACNFIPKHELANKRVLVFDDITIVGTQVARLRERLGRLYPKTSFVFLSFCVDDDWYLFDLARLDLPAVPLPTDQASQFYTSQVRTFRLLNRPFSVDFPILQATASARALWPHLCSVPWLQSCDVSTDFQQVARLESISSLLMAPFSAGLQCQILNDRAQAEVARLNGVPAKVRSYYNQETGELNLVPMVRLVVSRAFLKDHSNLFSHSLRTTGSFLDIIQTSSDTGDQCWTLYTSTNYLLSYIIGRVLTERWRHHAPEVGIHLRAEHIAPFDLGLLFGPKLAADLLPLIGALDEEIQRLPAFQHGFEACSLVVSPPDNRRKGLAPEATRLVAKLQPELDRELKFDSDPLGALGTLFRVMYQKLEVEQRKRLRAHAQMIRAAKAGTARLVTYADYAPAIPLQRLHEGFTWHDLLAILLRHRLLDPGDPNGWTMLAFAIDVLVDRGIIVPFVRTSRGIVQRVYRYGETGKDEDRDVFIAKSIEQLYEFVNTCNRRGDRGAISSIGMAKLLVLLRRYMHEHGAALDFLHRSRTHLAEANWLYGTVVVAQSNDPSSNGSKSQWFTGYLEDRHIIHQSPEGGYNYDPSFLVDREANGTVPAYPPEVLAGAVTLLKCAWFIDNRLGGHENSSNQWLVCLTSCNTAEQFLGAARGDIRLCFDERDYSLREALRSLRLSIGLELGRAQLELSEGCGANPSAALAWVQAKLNVTELKHAVGSDDESDLLAKVKQCTDQVELKKRLFDDRVRIARQIIACFNDGRTAPLTRLDLNACGDPIDVDPATPSQGVQVAIDRLMRFSHLVGALNSLAYHIGHLLETISRAPVKKGGGVYKQSTDGIVRRLDIVNEYMTQMQEAIAEARRGGLPVNCTFTLETIPLPADQDSAQVFVSRVSRAISDLERLFARVLVPVYEANYSDRQWLRTRQVLFPDSNRSTTDHRWIVWFDIKDSSGKVDVRNRTKAPALKSFLNEGLAAYVDQNPNVRIPRGPYDRDDEKFALFESDRDARDYIREVVSRLDMAMVYARIGVSGVADSGTPFVLDQDSNLPMSEQNHILPKRLGTFVPLGPGSPERYGAHTLILANQAKLELFPELKFQTFDDVQLPGVNRAHKIHYLEFQSSEELGLPLE